MSKRFSLLEIIFLIGYVLLLAGAVLWMNHRQLAGIVFAAGVALFICGRLLGEKGDWACATDGASSPTLQRLYRLRLWEMLALVVAAVAINLKGGFYFGVFITPSFWILPLTIAAVIEVYTTFRISSEENAAHSENNSQKT